MRCPLMLVASALGDIARPEQFAHDDAVPVAGPERLRRDIGDIACRDHRDREPVEHEGDRRAGRDGRRRRRGECGFSRDRKRVRELPIIPDKVVRRLSLY